MGVSVENCCVLISVYIVIMGVGCRRVEESIGQEVLKVLSYARQRHIMVAGVMVIF